MSFVHPTTPSSTSGSTVGSPASSHPPPTPLSPLGDSLSTPVDEAFPTGATSAPNAAAAPKRKPSRRANTAERRATHNAVERQRRETLNGRFLDLAALLPNLATVRRPSKSAIVNSSIALIHANRRQRLLAARELRNIKAEADALRNEVNAWRARSSLPRVEEPNRTPECLELLQLSDEQYWEDGDALNEMGEEERRAYELVMGGSQDDDGEDGLPEPIEEEDLLRGQGPMSATPLSHLNKMQAFVTGVPTNTNPNSSMVASQTAASAASLNGRVQTQAHMPMHTVMRGQNAANAGMPNLPAPQVLTFDNSLISHPGIHSGVNTMYEPSGHPHGHSYNLPVHPNFGASMYGVDATDKVAAWNAHQHQLFTQMSQQQQVQQAQQQAQAQNQQAGGLPHHWTQNQQQQPHHQIAPQSLYTPSAPAGLLY